MSETILRRISFKYKSGSILLDNQQWARFIERVNEDDVMDHLLSKIDESAKRNNLSYYRDILFQEFENKCFYCGKPVYKDKVQVDHFIPWSFIKDDKLWNFVLSCPQCNNNKRDKLAEGRYLSILIERNNQILVSQEKNMVNYQAKRLMKIYDWARKNGYAEIWTLAKKKIQV